MLASTDLSVDGIKMHASRLFLISKMREFTKLQEIDLPPKARGFRFANYGALLLQFKGRFALLRHEELSGRGGGCLSSGLACLACIALF